MSEKMKLKLESDGLLSHDDYYRLLLRYRSIIENDWENEKLDKMLNKLNVWYELFKSMKSENMEEL